MKRVEGSPEITEEMGRRITNETVGIGDARFWSRKILESQGFGVARFCASTTGHERHGENSVSGLVNDEFPEFR